MMNCNKSVLYLNCQNQQQANKTKVLRAGLNYKSSQECVEGNRKDVQNTQKITKKESSLKAVVYPENGIIMRTSMRTVHRKWIDHLNSLSF